MQWSQISNWAGKASIWGLVLFLAVVFVIVCRHAPILFLRSHGLSHRLAGAVHFFWIMFGAVCLFNASHTVQEHSTLWFLYDVSLGCFGILATLTAARDFPHSRVQNSHGQSGTLSKRAVVTQSEMIEHSFYQGLNLVQAIYLHAMWYVDSPRQLNRMALLSLVTAPWFLRTSFPVHSFSSNWRQESAEREHTKTELCLYRIKKCQYLFYKHGILHGINVSVAVPPVRSRSPSIPHTAAWRSFWLALNLSYVMEFFLQTMVKRRVLDQQHMLALQRLLMTVSTLAALVAVLGSLRIEASLLSLLLNFYHRGHEVVNTMLVGLALAIATHH